MAKVFEVDTGGTLPTSLISYWRLEDVEDFFGANTLTNNNTITFVAGKVVSGPAANAADTGDSNGSKYLSVASDLGITGGTVSFSCWIRARTTGAPAGGFNAHFISLEDSGNHVQYGAFINNTAGTYVFRTYRSRGGVGSTAISSGSISLDTWYYITFTYDSSDGGLIFYLNGSSVATGTDTGNGTAGAADHFNIFAQQNGAPFFSGLCDEFGIWSKELTTTEITDLYNGASGQTMIEQTTVAANAAHLNMLKVG